MATTELSGVTLSTKANVYFDGKVVSHSVTLAGGAKKTVGVIYPGEYHFGTDAPERMEIVAGRCEVRIDGGDAWKSYGAGDAFDVAGDSGFTIRVSDGLTEYVCSFG